MKVHKTCDGVVRRDFLRVGVAGMTGLHLAGYLSMSQAGQLSQAKGKNAIFVNLNGGPSHIDTFDLKPDAPAWYVQSDQDICFGN